MQETGAGLRSPVTANRHLAGVSGSYDQARSDVGVGGLIALAPVQLRFRPVVPAPCEHGPSGPR
jgi:hypothetical protein